MQEEKQHHHHLFHHHKEEVKAPVEAVVYSETAYGVDGAGKRYETTETGGYATTLPYYEKEPKAAGTFALYEKQQANKDEVHKHRHKIEEEIATAVGVGAGGYTFHEHREKKESKHEQENPEGKHNNHF